MDQSNGVATQMKKLKPLIVIVGLCFGLAGVIYAMRYVRGEKFHQTLELLFNAEVPQARKWNWCPKNTERIEFYISRASEDSVTPEQICNVVMEPVSTEKANREMNRYLKVGDSTESKTLEADKDLEVFKVDGLVFQSQTLSQILKGR